METINVFGNSYKVSKQAQYSYYSSLVIIALVLIGSYKIKSKAKKLHVLLYIIIYACLSPYITNCVSNGQCEEYGWYLSISNMMLAATLLMVFIKKKSKI